ncbi:RNase P subunit p30 family protein, partial [Nanoarchaeota archaeon]
GLNHILCDIARQNKKIIIFNFSSLFSEKNRGVVKGRMSQNIKLCRKYKVDTAIGSFALSPYQMRSHHDLFSLFHTLGMTKSEAKKSLESVFRKILQKKEISKQGFYSEKVKVLD